MFKNATIVFTVVTLISLSVVPVAQAQAQVPEEVALDAVRTRSAIPANEPAIDNWVVYQINTLRDNLRVGLKDADDNFLAAYHTQYTHEENSASFKTRFVEVSITRFTEHFAKGRDLQPGVGLALARALAGIDDLSVIPGLKAGLAVEGQPGIRYTCARAFTAFMPRIAEDAVAFAETIGALREAGKKEPNGVARTRIYEALSYRNENLEPAVTAILEVVKARLRARAEDKPACDGAEDAAFNFLRTELNNIENKGAIVAVLAAYLRMDVERYPKEQDTNVSETERYNLELCTDAAEGLLIRIVAPPAPAPKVREAMRKAEDRDLNLPLELYKWIGTGQTKGVLNNPPWNVRVGAPIPD